MKSERQQAQLVEERAEERTRLAQEKYENWLATKATQLRRSKSDLSSANATRKPGPVQRQGLGQVLRQGQVPAQAQRHLTSRTSLPPAETQRRLVAWEREKIARLRALRASQEQDEALYRQVVGARRELSAEAWEQWATEARNRPRPVPIGRGLDSLRGSMAPHYVNPKEWQPPLLDTPRRKEEEQNKQQQQPHTNVTRPGPDYERLERLAQPRRTSLRTATARSFGSDLRSSADAGDGNEEEQQEEGAEAEAELEAESEAEEDDSAQGLPQPQRQPSVWSKQNAYRARQLRSIINDRAMEARMRQLKLRDDQLEQLRQQQHMQASKQLPRKYHEKRQQLKEHLKVWVQQGELLPERLYSGEGEKLQTQLPREMKPDQKSETDTDGELKALWKRKHAGSTDQRQQQSNAMPQLAQAHEHEYQRVQERQQVRQQEQLQQELYQQPRSSARTTRRPQPQPQPQQRTRSSEAPCHFKRQQKSRPWR